VTLLHVIAIMGVGRVLLGVTPFAAARRSATWLGFPADHDTATSRLMARFFGVRDVGLGVLVFYALAHPPLLSFVLIFNGLTDLGDLVAIAIPLVRREGIDRAAWTSAAFAAPAAIAWLVVRSVWK
jgi:hypothetical protein